MSGKIVLTQTILRDVHVFDVEPKKVLYVCKYDDNWQKQFKDVEFIDEIPKEWDDSVPTLIVIDNQITEKTVVREFENMFVRASHHKNASVILITQNLFYNNPYFTTISLNSTYIILFKSARSQQQIEQFGRQI